MADELTQEQLAELDAQYPRGFRAVWPDGFTVHGVQFPSGRCVVDSPAGGLWKAAVSLEALELHASAVIDWDPAESRGRVAGYAEAAQALRDGRGYESWCADTGRYSGTRADHAAYLEWIASRATTEETPR